MPQRDEGISWRRAYTWLCFAGAFALAAAVTWAVDKAVDRVRRRWELAKLDNSFSV